MITIIIPTFNEAEGIGELLHYLRRHGDASMEEIIVCDAGSQDNTLEIAEGAGAKVLSSPSKGRAAQMNFGASVAKGEVLYFIHADSFPPVSFCADIRQALTQGFSLGRYRTRFDSNKWILAVNGFFTQFDWFICYGGDQTLFITKKLFAAINGFDSSMRIMEDYEIIVRAKALARYKIFSKAALVSARKYDTNSWLSVQRANYTIVQLFKKGATQEVMVSRYKALLNYR